MASFMQGRGLIPDVVLCSPAERAMQTWELAAPVVGSQIPTLFLDDIYMASPDELLCVLQSVGNTAQSTLLIGHNPGLEVLAAGLSGPGSDRNALRLMEQKFPTAALAVLECDMASWGDLAFNGCRLRKFFRPKHLPAV